MKELSRLFRTYRPGSHSGSSTILPKVELVFNVTPHISGKNPLNPLSDLIEAFLPVNQPKTTDQIRADVSIRLRQAAEQRKRGFKSRGDVLRQGDFVLLREHPISDTSNKIIAKFCPLYSRPLCD
ncbi:hypothetical protein MTP99_006947 [Tenebrio molitor]|jgi:hypothetical protein|nr:hypothetical protein MTP99_006947 [Tenebrio molitor]